MTLRAIEIVESCLNFFVNAMKMIRQGRMFASHCRKPASRQCEHSASLAFAFPLRSRYSEFLTLSILRVKNSLPLTVFTQLQRREASRLE